MAQADATSEVVAGAVSGLVTGDYLDSRLEGTESRMAVRFEKMDAHFDRLESSIDSRFEKVDSRLDRLEGSIDSRFEKVDSRFEKLEVGFDLKLARWALTLVLSQIAVSGCLFALLRYTGTG